MLEGKGMRDHWGTTTLASITLAFSARAYEVRNVSECTRGAGKENMKNVDWHTTRSLRFPWGSLKYTIAPTSVKKLERKRGLVSYEKDGFPIYIFAT